MAQYDKICQSIKEFKFLNHLEMQAPYISSNVLESLALLLDGNEKLKFVMINFIIKLWIQLPHQLANGIEEPM